MIALDGCRSESKMMIYKIHQLRVLVAAIVFIIFMLLVILLSPPQKCVQVSVSVRQWRPYPIKRTRVVQALDASRLTSESNRKFMISSTADNSDAWFRTRLLLPPDNAEVEDIEDDNRDEVDDYSKLGDNYEEDEYDDLPYNKIFEDGDFDYNETTQYNSSFLARGLGIISYMYLAYKSDTLDFSKWPVLSNSSHEEQNFTVTSKSLRKSLKHRQRNITLINVEGIPIVEDRIFWSEELEKRTPKGANDEDVHFILTKLRSLTVQKVEPPTWNRCGRPKNQFVTFEDGSKACVRYRAPHQYLVQGEVLSFYLSRLLDIQNVPVVSLAAVKPGFQGMWSKPTVKENLHKSKWEVNTTVALIQWIENLERDKMPPILLSALVHRNTLSTLSAVILKLPTRKLTQLLQWSDLIVFDYITGNYDRVASMQDAADKEGKTSILQETIHNLVQSKSTGGLWLIDNESGLLDSYSLLYGITGKDGRFLKFHRQMLNTICIFRRQTVERIRWLHSSNKAGSILMKLVRQLEPLFTPVNRERDISKRLQERIAEVNAHVERCLSELS